MDQKVTVGFPGLLTLFFVVAKLCNVISWSWWWVLSPALIILALVILVTLADEGNDRTE